MMLFKLFCNLGKTWKLVFVTRRRMVVVVVVYAEWSKMVTHKVLVLHLFSHLCVTEQCHVEGEAAPWEELVEARFRPYLPFAVLLRVNVLFITIPVTPQKNASRKSNTYRYYCSLQIPLHQKRGFANICRSEACFCSPELHCGLFHALRSAMLTSTVQSVLAADV